MKKRKFLYVGNALVQHGNSPTTADTLPPKLRELGVEVIVVSTKRNKIARLLDMTWTTLREVRSVEGVLIDAYSTSNFWYLRIISKICSFYKVPYYPLLHGGDLPKRLKNNPKTCHRIFNNAKANIAPSLYLKTAFEKAGFINCIHIPNSISLSDYVFKARETVEPRLLWVRSFAKIYNPQLALSVLEELLKTYPKATLCMVGPEKDGSLESCYAFAKANELPVTFTKRLTKEEWISLSTDYDIFINTTNFDNLPVSVLEAMALGLPVVSTNVGGLPHLITHTENGLLVPPKDVQSFTKNLIELLSSPDLAMQLSQAGRTTATTFDWEMVKLQWQKLFYKM